MCFFCVSYFGKSIRQKMLESSEVKMYQTILFDLDGTITDSGSGIMRSILYANRTMRLAAIPARRRYVLSGAAFI